MTVSNTDAPATIPLNEDNRRLLQEFNDSIEPIAAINDRSAKKTAWTPIVVGAAYVWALGEIINSGNPTGLNIVLGTASTVFGFAVISGSNVLAKACPKARVQLVKETNSKIFLIWKEQTEAYIGDLHEKVNAKLGPYRGKEDKKCTDSALINLTHLWVTQTVERAFESLDQKFTRISNLVDIPKVSAKNWILGRVLFPLSDQIRNTSVTAEDCAPLIPSVPKIEDILKEMRHVRVPEDAVVMNRPKEAWPKVIKKQVKEYESRHRNDGDISLQVATINASTMSASM